MASKATPSLSLLDAEVQLSNTASQPSGPQKSTFAYPPIVIVTLAAHPSAASLTNLFGSPILKPQQSGALAGQTMRTSRAVVHLAAGPEPQALGAYYVDSPSDEEEGVAVEAQVDSWMGDLELLYQEQLKSLVEDWQSTKLRKGKGKPWLRTLTRRKTILLSWSWRKT